MSRKKRRVTPADLRAGAIFLASVYGTSKDLKRIARQIRKNPATVVFKKRKDADGNPVADVIIDGIVVDTIFRDPDTTNWYSIYRPSSRANWELATCGTLADLKYSIEHGSDSRYKDGRVYRQNPTRLLRNIRGEATFLVQQLGREKALQVARTMTADGRRNALLMRMIERSGVHKLRKRPVRKSMYDKLIEEFGVTDAMSARGFILADGTCLNLGQYDDHRIINCVYTNSQAAEKRYGSRYGAFRHLCELYNMIRWIPEPKQCEVFVEPTRQQLNTMRELAENGMLKEIEVHHRGDKAVLEAQDADTLIGGVEAIYG